ncbi:MAG: hypothetical protein H6710_06830 [Myxococcales bacterium]|nr:hypothetical protein [Myxococcales bacterium]
MAEAGGGAQAAGLLHQPAPAAAETVRGGGWAYSPALMIVASLFIAYHTAAVLLHSTPSGGLARKYGRAMNHSLRIGLYMRATANVQNWTMFAPNPHRNNVFVRVLVDDRNGKTWDAEHDLYGRRRYPYVIYDRLAKVNRRLGEQSHYHQPYAAWVCREWERTHGGEPAKRVRLVRLESKIPPPRVVYRASEAIRPSWTSIGFDPMRLPLARRELEVFECDLLPQGQLSPEIRARLGLPPAPAGHYKPLELETWWTRAEGRR